MRHLPGGARPTGFTPAAWVPAVGRLSRNHRHGVTRNGHTGTVRRAAGRHDGLRARPWEELAMWTARLLERESVPACTSGQP